MEPFDYSDILADPTFIGETTKLKIANGCSYKLILIRGLIGSIKIRHSYSGVEFEQTTNWLDLDGSKAATPPFEKMLMYIANDDEFKIDDLCNVFSNKKFIHANRDFFKAIALEFNNFYYHQHKESYTTAFVYLYRILEKISYAFPMMYVYKTQDFTNSFVELKKFINQTDKGELGFFKRFLLEIFKDDDYLKTSIEINITSASTETNKQFYNAILKACGEKNIDDSKLFIKDKSVENSTLSVRFASFSSFMINIRNRFFHFTSSGQPNLNSEDITDSDAFFKLINGQSAYWLGVLTFEVLKYEIARSE